MTVLEKGFAYEERTYPSLSEIARQITGTRWNGPKFFGLRPANRSSDNNDCQDGAKARPTTKVFARYKAIEGQAMVSKQRKSFAARSTLANRLSTGWSLNSIRSMPSAKPARPTSSRRPMRAGRHCQRAMTIRPIPAAISIALPCRSF